LKVSIYHPLTMFPQTSENELCSIIPKGRKLLEE
jgi:hypothetical protein